MSSSHERLLHNVGQDLRLACRSLFRDRHFSVVAVLTLGITFAGLVVMAALVYSVVLKPLPYPAPDRLVVVWEKDQRFPVARGRELRTADFIDFRREARQFESIGLYRRLINDVDIDGSPVRAEVWSVSSSVLPMLGASATVGRLFTVQDEQTNVPKTILLSYECWDKYFVRNPGVIGKTISLPGHVSATIVGVVAPGFHAPAVGTLKASVQLGFDAPQNFPLMWQVYQPLPAEIAARNRGSYNGIARLRADASVRSASEELSAIGLDLTRRYPDSNSGITPLVTPLIDEVSGDFTSALWILLATVACVLLIGVGNLTNLQVVRNTARDRELSIRAALGASTSRLLLEFLTESAVLVSLAAFVGLALGSIGLHALIPLLPAGFPRTDEIGLSGSAVAVVVAAGIFAVVALGVIPSLRVRRADGLDILQQALSRRTTSRSQRTIQRAVIAVETAVAFVLLIAASLLLNSWYHLITVSTGLDETNVTAVSLSLPPKYATRDAQVAFFPRALDAVRTYGGIEAAGIVTSPPLAGLELMWPEIKPKGREEQSSSGVTLSLRAVTPDYFRVFRISTLNGAIFSGEETEKSEPVIVLNASGARALFGTEDPVGKVIVSFGTSYRVVAVIPDVKMRRLDMAATPQAYASYRQWPSGSEAPVTLVLRSKGLDRNIDSVIRDRIAGLDRDVAITTNTLGDIRWQKTATERFRTALFLLFALVALGLSLIGIIGVVSYAVAQRRREIGIRIAIGANENSVIRLMTCQSLIPAFIGLALGFIASRWLNRFISGFLFAISATDAVTVAGTGVLFVCAAFLASYLPARRAARIDAWTTLRHE